MYVWVQLVIKVLQHGSDAEISFPESGRTPVKLKQGSEQSYWSIHAIWSISAVRRPRPDYDGYVGHCQHRRRFVDFLAQSCECVFEVVWCEADSAAAR